jgi:[ribosomal protein S5]-alanine N-acetyltransferase
MVILSTERLILREFEKQDFPSVHEYASDPEVVKFMPWGPNSPSETRRFIENAIQNQVKKPRTSYELAIILNNDLIGGCGITIHSMSDKRGEIGYCIRRGQWGRGLGTETATKLIEFGFKELQLHRIIAKCDTSNHASYKVMEKKGMTKEGVLREEKHIHGEWRDSYLYSILEYEWINE